ncbi:MAG: formylmethanofuran dehydrogenase subunit E family protein [Candidatus Omnitrophota bacterium]
MIPLNTAREFHGHLGPWLVLGLLMGEYGVKKIGAKKYFGLNVEVNGLNSKPRTCLIDGLQLSTGCTLGKGNIKILKSKGIFVNFINNKTNKKISISLNNEMFKKIESTEDHSACEILAKKLYRQKPQRLFVTSST